MLSWVEMWQNSLPICLKLNGSRERRMNPVCTDKLSLLLISLCLIIPKACFPLQLSVFVSLMDTAYLFLFVYNNVWCMQCFQCPQSIFGTTQAFSQLVKMPLVSVCVDSSLFSLGYWIAVAFGGNPPLNTTFHTHTVHTRAVSCGHPA